MNKTLQQLTEAFIGLRKEYKGLVKFSLNPLAKAGNVNHYGGDNRNEIAMLQQLKKEQGAIHVVREGSCVAIMIWENPIEGNHNSEFEGALKYAKELLDQLAKELKWKEQNPNWMEALEAAIANEGIGI